MAHLVIRQRRVVIVSNIRVSFSGKIRVRLRILRHGVSYKLQVGFDHSTLGTKGLQHCCAVK